MRIHWMAAGFVWLAGLGMEAGAAPGSAPPDYRFQAEVLAEGMAQPMELEVAPDGRIFFNEIGGLLKIYQPDSRAVVTAGRVETTTMQENGFLGFALDPDFAANRWIYLFYFWLALFRGE